jgi:DNA (cytosine-5)-methyltransferase 1
MTMLTLDQACKAFEINTEEIRRWEKKGLIRAQVSGRDRLYDADALLQQKLKLVSPKAVNRYRVLKAEKPEKPLNAIELFAGAGGTALGFENAGIHHVLMNEFAKDAVDTLKLNFTDPTTKIVGGDVHELDFTSYKDKVDLVQAGFPCQAFSYAGKRLGFEETRGTLFFEFARCVKETRPKIAVGENVKGLLKHDGGKTLKVMTDVLNDLGYEVRVRVLHAQYLDVPQKRERLIILAVRKDLVGKVPFIYPKEKSYTISLREALKDCPPSEGAKYPKRKAEILSLVPEGGYWRDLPLDLQKEYMKGSFKLSGGKTGMARRLAWDEPSLTLTCAPAQKQTERCHPSETRPLTVREYARIQTFPDSWTFAGSVGSKYKQIGNAVPVNLAYHIGLCVRAMLDPSLFDPETMEKVP